MSLLDHSTYKPPLFFKSAHLQTVYPSLFRKVKGVYYTRERIATPDEDFIDLDWSRVDANKVVIICHGLESSSREAYMLGMVKAFNRRGWDGVAFNFRGCSGESNRLLRSYHSGASDDLHTVVEHILNQDRYSALALVGFSLGGNLVIKYMGEKKAGVSPLIRAAAAISTPCHLESCAERMAERANCFYMKRFIRALKKKAERKSLLPSAFFKTCDFKTVKNFKEFDDLYTAPVHGFVNAKEYWTKCSGKQFIPHITIPTLLINAVDDPFLARECYPLKEARESDYFTLEIPQGGGHVGFITFNKHGEYWHETRTTSFILATCQDGDGPLSLPSVRSLQLGTD